MTDVNVAVLKSIADASKGPNDHGFVGAEFGKPLQDAGYIVTNMGVTNPNNANEVAARVTDAGLAFLKSQDASGKAPTGATVHAGSVGTLVSGFVAPAQKRRGGPNAGAPSKYPFDKIDVNGSFFVGNSEVDKGDAFKTMSATVSSTNRRNSEPTGEKEMVERAKRGPDRKAILDDQGKKVMETVEIEKRKPLKHYKIVAVEGGKKYGEWTAPESGAIIIRDL